MIEKNGKQRISFLLDSISFSVGESYVVINSNTLEYWKLKNKNLISNPKVQILLNKVLYVLRVKILKYYEWKWKWMLLIRSFLLECKVIFNDNDLYFYTYQ